MTESTGRRYYLRSSSGWGNLSLPSPIYSSSSLSNSLSSSLSNSSENLLGQPTSQSQGQNGVRCCQEAVKLITSRHIEEVMQEGEKIKNNILEKMKTLSVKVRDERLNSMSQLAQSQQFFSSQEGLSSQTLSQPNNCWTSRIKRRRVFPNEEIDEDEEIRAPTPNGILFDRLTSQNHFERRRLYRQEYID